MAQISRRHFLQGSLAAALAQGQLKLSFAGQQPGTTKGVSSGEILVYVYLRGGLDGLNFLPPISGADQTRYVALRPNIFIPPGGTLDLGGGEAFGLHPSAPHLQALYQAGKLAIVQTTGLPEANRSHFDAQAYMDLGTPGDKSTPDGWLTRHLAGAGVVPPGAVIPILAAGNYTPASLQDEPRALTVSYPEEYGLTAGHWAWEQRQQDDLPNFYQGSTSTDQAGAQALTAVDVLSSANWDYRIFKDRFTSLPGGPAIYPTHNFGDLMKMVSEMIQLDVGLQVATVDFGGWDTHANQGTGDTGYFATLVGVLSQALHALYTDLHDTPYAPRLSIVVSSEFGRRAYDNSDDGTDHGYGGLMMALGENVNGGSLFGTFPGLATEDLFEGDDVNVTTDFRRVLSEALIRRLGDNRLSTIFPGYTGYAPLGVFQGTDLPPI